MCFFTPSPRVNKLRFVTGIQPLNFLIEEPGVWRHLWYQLQHGTQARVTFDNVGPSMGLTLQFEVSSPLNEFRELPSQIWRTS